MQTEAAQQALTPLTPLTQYALRLEGRLEKLDERIAALSHLLDARLEQHGQLQQWLHQQPATPQSGPHQSTRESRLRSELRGLLVLRYQIITRYCNELGAPLALQLVCYAEERLEAKGWAPGVDGLDVQALKRLDGAH